MLGDLPSYPNNTDSAVFMCELVFIAVIGLALQASKKVILNRVRENKQRFLTAVN
jgi:hypothetical protein